MQDVEEKKQRYENG